MAVYRVCSPDGRVCLELTLEGGVPHVRVEKDGVEAAARAPVGLRLEGMDLSCGLRYAGQARDKMDESYQIPAFKKQMCYNRANTLEVTFEKAGCCLVWEGRAYDDGAAFRLRVQGEGTARVTGEATALEVPGGAGMVYAMKHVFSYEDHYQPTPRQELWQNRLVFPMLVELGHGLWALYAEADVQGGYWGSTLQSRPENPGRLYVVPAPDQLEPVKVELPFATPWRAVMVGDLQAIVTSNLLENLNPPSIVQDTSFIRPGLAAWSWMTENDAPKDEARSRQYIDFAAQMGWTYYLADAGWPGNVDIPALVAYGKQRGVGIWLWEHSADMREQAVAEQKMATYQAWGVAGIKIDFFESETTERVGQYAMLARLAAKHRLMLNFHGCMKPAGEIRTWPHVMTREGVFGAEYLQHFSTFLPGGPDAAHNCTLPFTRGAVGPMDYTPVAYRSYQTGTTDAHQTGLTVIFTSYIQHIGEGIDPVLENPCRPFLSAVPASWDQTLVLEGYPASHVTMARGKGGQWFVAGICARKPRTARFALDFLPDGDWMAELYADDLGDLRAFDVSEGTLPPPDKALLHQMDSQPSRMRPSLHGHDMHAVRVERFAVKSGQWMEIPMVANGGFAMRLMPVGEKQNQ
nr:glycoside hydrolase family 97 catalytic domain-containing protein [bacterium]